MELSLGFSPCPNDTFIFDALIHQKIDTQGLQFKVQYEDVETLNQKALAAELDITKLSFHAFAYVADTYALLDAGSALGFGVGPLLICADEKFTQMKPNETIPFPKVKVGIPGKLTTANFLLGIAFPELTDKHEMVFSEIEQAVTNKRMDLGLIIHENRFTYHERGLHKVIDLGDYWEQKTGCAIPLGGIVIKRNLDDKLKNTVNTLIRKSVEYAFAHPEENKDFIKQHAQEMDDEVIQKHIDLYVNQYSIDLGIEGRKAIDYLFRFADDAQLIPTRREKSIYLHP